MDKFARCVLASVLIALSGCAAITLPAGNQLAPAVVMQPAPVNLLPAGPAPAPPPAVMPRPAPVAVLPPPMVAYPWAPPGPCRICSVDHLSLPVE
jgi:hypothetical protein